jgi:hypothetical protein
MVWLVRILLALAGVVAAWFVSRDDLRFSTIQFVVLLIMLLLACIIGFYFPKIRQFFKRR